MNEDERRLQPDILKKALFECIDRHIEQYQMTFAEVIGVLEAVKFQQIVEMRGNEDDL